MNRKNDHCIFIVLFFIHRRRHPNPTKLRHFSNFSESSSCVVLRLASGVPNNSRDVGRSSRQLAQAGCAAALQPFCQFFRQAEVWASAA